MTPILDEAKLLAALGAQPYPLLFVTVSGAHLYGFPSADSDVDLRGVHLLPAEDVVGLKHGPETLEAMGVREGLEVDLVTHDARKFFSLLLRRNGYVLEQLLSPLVVRSSEAHRELKALAPGVLTRHHAHHYLGFAETQWRLFAQEAPPRVKPLLYTFRVLLTGLHLMRTGALEANLGVLNETFKLPYLPELIARKREGAEKGALEGAELAFYAREYERLRAELEAARDASALPEAPSAEAQAALHDLLVRLRLGRMPLDG
jgi:hypothetical protein